MSPVAFIDTNVPIYATGRPHPLKEPCVQVLFLVSEHPQSFVTDAEVFQELLHRSLSLRVWPQNREMFFEFAGLMHNRVESIRVGDIELAARLADNHEHADSRDLLHAAIMRRLGVRHIVTADTGFDRLPEVERLDPTRVDDWQESLLA